MVVWENPPKTQVPSKRNLGWPPTTPSHPPVALEACDIKKSAFPTFLRQENNKTCWRSWNIYQSLEPQDFCYFQRSVFGAEHLNLPPIMVQWKEWGVCPIGSLPFKYHVILQWNDDYYEWWETETTVWFHCPHTIWSQKWTSCDNYGVPLLVKKYSKEMNLPKTKTCYKLGPA